MTGDDTTEEREGVLSRREMLGATTVLGGAALLPSGTAGASTSGSTKASADMQTSTEPRIKLGDDYAIDDSPNGNGDLVIEHLPSGATFSYDSSAGSWTMGSFSTDKATIATTTQVVGASEDLQTVINNAGPYTRLICNPNNQRTVSATIEITTNGISLEGANLVAANGLDSPVVKVHGCDDVVLDRLRIDGNKSNQSTTQATTKNGVTITNASNITVSRCDVTNPRDQGILATSWDAGSADAGTVESITVVDCVVEGPDNGGIIFAGGGSNTSQYGYCAANTVKNAANEQFQAIDGYSFVTFTGNHATGNSPAFAVESHSGRNATAQYGTEIIGNTGDVVGSAVRLDNGSGLDMADVHVLANRFAVDGSSRTYAVDASSTEVNRLIISGNHFEGPSTYSTDDIWGIGVVNTPTVAQLVITGNTFKNLVWAAYIQNINAAPVISDNSGESLDNGVNLVNTDGANVSGNTFKASTLGIGVDAGDGGTHRGNRVINNTVLNATTGVEATESSGTLNNYAITENAIGGATTPVNDAAAGANTVVKDNLTW